MTPEEAKILRAQRLKVVEMVAAAALARTFTSKADMVGWTEATDSTVGRYEDDTDLTRRTYRAVWDKMLSSVRQQFAYAQAARGDGALD